MTRAILLSSIIVFTITATGIISRQATAATDPIPGFVSSASEKSAHDWLFTNLPCLFPNNQKLTLPPPVASHEAHPAAEHYPWRRDIVTTTFWVGEAPTKRNPVPNHASCWDPDWARNYGGTDNPDPDGRSHYIPVKFTPRQNPFYCALPYNDVEHGATKPEASKVIPWFKETFKRSGQSVLKDRWIAIRFRGKIAYAQWADAGPFRTDHWEYVFGQERPKKNLNKGAGLDVSPAVRDFLGMNDSDVTDWRFVDFSEVPHGPWAQHGNNNTFVLNARAGKTVLAAGIIP